jgi:glycosyltransferase involved in cell wall biosynthesis
MTARFTVLLPVNRPPDLLPFAIDSVLAQQGAEFELFIICDGAPPATIECAKAFAARDPRVRVFAFEKGERHGEAHRHTAMAEARGPFVAQIGDDDLWFPDYLATLGRLLDRVDFGNLLQADVSMNGAIHVHTGDLGDPAFRRKMLNEAFNFFGPTAAGYRLSAYRRLPVGWSPAPPDLWTDLYMWRKFLVRDDLTFGTTFAVRLVKLAAQDRAAMSLPERAAELSAMAKLLAAPQEREAFSERVFKTMWRSLEDARGATAHALGETAQSLADSTAEVHDLRERQQALIQERDARQAELADLVAQHQATLASTSWLVTRPVRWLGRRLLSARKEIIRA